MNKCTKIFIDWVTLYAMYFCLYSLYSKYNRNNNDLFAKNYLTQTNNH